jgi:hypothetical protein
VRAARRDRVASPREGAPARGRTRRSRWRPCLGPHARAAPAGSPLAGRGCHHTCGARRRSVRGQTPAAVRTRENGCPLRGATSAIGPRADFRPAPCSVTALWRQLCEPRGRAAVRAHRYESAVSAEIAGGTLPEKRFSRKSLRHSVPVRHARVGRETARAAAAGRTARPAW